MEILRENWSTTFLFFFDFFQGKFHFFEQEKRDRFHRLSLVFYSFVRTSQSRKLWCIFFCFRSFFNSMKNLEPEKKTRLSDETIWLGLLGRADFTIRLENLSAIKVEDRFHFSTIESVKKNEFCFSFENHRFLRE